ncbi:MAG: Gfo/Idh/MocA family oxidoreductase [Actinobacteria bacterium]|nr:Gfo/Idh/MocA family oxidoreductase [Actinomycetota bacterium]
MEPVRWGILSTARINHAVIDPARESEKAVVIAVASRNLARAETYAREQGIERSYGSYKALLADDDVEAVYVSLPNALHVPWAIKALEAGKHVLCEKPLGRTPEVVEQAFDTADRQDRVLMEAFMYRHHPLTRKLKELVDSGALGELKQIRTAFTFTLDNRDDVRWRPELEGGSLLDLGCYCVSVSRLLGGEPERVYGRQRLAPTGIDVGFTGTLEFPGEASAQFHCAFDLPAESYVEAIGTTGKARVVEPFRCNDPHVDLNGSRIDVDDVDRYLLQLENLSEAIRGKAEPLLGRDDALGQAATIAALYRAAETAAPETPRRAAAV